MDKYRRIYVLQCANHYVNREDKFDFVGFSEPEYPNHNYEVSVSHADTPEEFGFQLALLVINRCTQSKGTTSHPDVGVYFQKPPFLPDILYECSHGFEGPLVGQKIFRQVSAEDAERILKSATSTLLQRTEGGLENKIVAPKAITLG